MNSSKTTKAAKALGGQKEKVYIRLLFVVKALSIYLFSFLLTWLSRLSTITSEEEHKKIKEFPFGYPRCHFLSVSPPVTTTLSRQIRDVRFLFWEFRPALSLRTHESDKSFFPGEMESLPGKKTAGIGRRATSFLRELGGGVGFVSEIRLQRVLEFAQRRDQSLQREITRSVGRVHAGYVLKLTRLADVALGRQNNLLLYGFLLLLPRRR